VTQFKLRLSINIVIVRPTPSCFFKAVATIAHDFHKKSFNHEQTRVDPAETAGVLTPDYPAMAEKADGQKYRYNDFFGDLKNSSSL